jgi:hypothetical protein
MANPRQKIRSNKQLLRNGAKIKKYHPHQRRAKLLISKRLPRKETQNQKKKSLN